MTMAGLKEVRMWLGLTQKEMANLMGVSDAYVTMMEKGKRKVSKKFKKLLDFYCNLELIHHAQDGISNLYSSFFPCKFNVCLGNSCIFLEELDSWCSNFLNQSKSFVLNKKTLPEIEPHKKNVLKILSLLSPSSVFIDNIFFYHTLDELSSGCICLDVADDLSWHLSFYPVCGHPVSFTGNREDLLLFYLAFRFELYPHQGKIAVNIREGFLRFYNIQLYSIELKPIQKIISNYILLKKLDIPLSVRPSPW
jgi:DNA-binding XRE family transcriptional regulator